MPPPAHARTAYTTLSFWDHQNNAVLQVKTSANAGMAILVTLDAEIDLARGESFEGVKKSGFYQETKHSSDVFCH